MSTSSGESGDTSSSGYDEQGEAEGEATDGSGTGSDGALDMSPSGCESACDPYDLSACESDEKCVPATCDAASGGFDTHMCRPVTGDQKAGEVCVTQGRDGFDDCAAGLVCWGADAETGEGHCEPLCHGDADEPSCEAGRVCATFGAANIALCVSSCNPLEPLCPIDGDACLPLPSSESFACLPGPGESGASYGEPCQFANACEPGALCIDGSLVPETGCGEEQDCCSPLCDLIDPQACPGEGQLCQPLDPALNVAEDYPNVGVCALP